MSNRLLLLLFSTVLLCACGVTPVHLDTPNGPLLGYSEKEVEHFLGVPYASPPVGALRWRSPQAVEPWTAARSAQKQGDICAQTSLITGSLIGSEDCLYLNIWAPTEKPAQALPVMVWIHGGGFILGQGSYGKSDWRRLALSENVVVVSINYRLGIFGFLAHDRLSVENRAQPGSGNYGIEDQTAALRWVRDNISAFGGDPERVTIFGQSAGAISVCAQLASPAAKGLFQRAIIQSGPCATPLPSHTAVSKLGTQAQEKLGCDDAADTLDCMREKSTEAVASTLPPDPTLGFGKDYTIWWPNQDETVLPLQLLEAFESGRFNQVPVINGATLDEATLLIWLSHNMRFKPLREEQYIERLEHLAGSPELAQQVARQYPLEDYDSPFAALSASFSDGFFNCSARRQALALSRHVPTWNYQFDYRDAAFFLPWADLGAYHAAELQYVMGRPWSFMRRDFKKQEQAMADSIRSYWAEFARTGNPNGTQALQWPAYNNSSDESLLFNLQNSVATGVHEQECRFWDELPYLRPAYE